METASTASVSLVQSRLFGDNKGTSFNDVEAVGGYPGAMTIDVDHPIHKVQIFYGDVIDGLIITYMRTDGSHIDIHHGRTKGAPTAEFTLSPTENIFAISGKAGDLHHVGNLPPWANRICQLNFVIYNNSSSHSRICGPYGNGRYGNAFRVTANGIFVAFGGYATNDDATNPGSIYGLTFTDVAYRKA